MRTLPPEHRPQPGGGLQLRKWRVVDAQGNSTDTTLINPRYGVPLSDELFVYEEPEQENIN